MRRRHAALALAAIVLSSASPVAAGYVLFDVVDRQTLEASDADAVIAPGRAADLLLVAVLCQRLAARDIALGDRVTVLPVADDPGPHLSAHDPVEIGELLQLLLLTDSRTAAKTLAWAAGPSIGRTLTRMQQVSARLGLKRTSPADDWPFGIGVNAPETPGRRGSTTVRELGRLALAVMNEPEIRRRIALDGVPISNGGLIVRATSPLIALHADAAATPIAESATSPGVRIALAERDTLSLLAVVASPRPDETLTATLDRGFHRYRRVEVVREGQAVGPTVHVRGGIIPTFNAVAAEPWALTTKESNPSALAFRLQLPKQIDAPVEVHQPLGELVVERDGKVLAVVPLVAPLAIAPSGWLDTAHQ